MQVGSPRKPATKTESETSLRSLATLRSGHAPAACARSKSALQQAKPKSSTATNDWQKASASFLLLCLQLPQSLLRFLDVGERQFSRLDQVRHDGLRASAE